MPSSEFEYINWLRKRTPPAAHVRVGPGDDAAVLDLPAGAPLVVTTDMLLEGSCFLLAEAGPRRAKLSGRGTAKKSILKKDGRTRASNTRTAAANTTRATVKAMRTGEAKSTLENMVTRKKKYLIFFFKVR